jgi:hypothetical protein
MAEQKRNPPEPGKSKVPLRSDEHEVNPAVKSWLQNVLIPAMVKRYLEANIVNGNVTSSQDNEE